VIVPSGAVRVLVATKPVDFRKGMEGLAALVREAMGADPFCGTVYVFRVKRADRVKLIFWDGTGMVLVAKRLEDGKFRWPRGAGRAPAAECGRAAGLARGARLAARTRAAAHCCTGGDELITRREAKRS
jgi:transposase